MELKDVPYVVAHHLEVDTQNPFNGIESKGELPTYQECNKLEESIQWN